MIFATVLLVALLHICFLVLEMFLWTKPVGRRIFRQSMEKARDSATLAANQGLYNGFLAAGLIWGLIHPHPAFGREVEIFFLSCVILAGLYGAWTVNHRILLVQALPAVLGLLLIMTLSAD